ncbi:hypothetical protein CEUSTIGMA_g8341.t1 [Chlamydomonas eustigma]|uniref:Uncharacterized protein n=1 Tax=Chlamydomonas eustigma TaxID=1157962 RepID=A0A250XCY5_9CHLO|nr:hypothetical protein CEUSTIGMA_g8341.t1 [Chlamydomonas eustigma]|eukprot:GAX80906.1 hypothetical protein CEUSTIGMA_g8341.t1 [Chlamydomonas eustigma]
MRDHINKLSQELASSLNQLRESQLEKELLAAERTLIIVNLQALTSALDGIALSSAASESQASYQMLTSYDRAAESVSTERVTALKSALPPSSIIKALCEQSELRPHIEGLKQRTKELRGKWESTQSELQVKISSTEKCNKELRAEMELLREEASKTKNQASEITKRMNEQREQWQDQLRVAAKDLFNQQQDTLKSSGTADRMRLEVTGLEKKLAEALEAQASAEESEAKATAHKLEMMEELNKLRQEHRRLQSVVEEAEAQLGVVMRDVTGVKQQQLLLGNKLSNNQTRNMPGQPLKTEELYSSALARKIASPAAKLGNGEKRVAFKAYNSSNVRERLYLGSKVEDTRSSPNSVKEVFAGITKGKRGVTRRFGDIDEY